jgi:dephospho-CoA kinase
MQRIMAGMDLIGMTGTHGAGKGTAVSLLVDEYGYTHVSVSAFLSHEAKRRKLDLDRGGRSTVANELRGQSPTALMEATHQWGREQYPDASAIVLEPQYTIAEVQYVQNRGGIVIAVDADIDVRYERIQERGSEKDNVSYEEFVEWQQRELRSDDPNKANLADAIEQADYRVMNNGTPEELFAQIADIVQRARA